MRTWNLSLIVGVFAAGCSEAPGLCTSCPKIEGHYELTCQALSSATQDCATFPPPAPPATLDITRGGAEIHATLNGVSASGQLADTADFTLLGTQDLGGDAGELQTLSLRGFYVAGTSKDGGTPALLQVKWITHFEHAEKFCDAERPCTATKK